MKKKRNPKERNGFLEKDHIKRNREKPWKDGTLNRVRKMGTSIEKCLSN